MKNIKTLLTILGAASILFSCGDDDNANGPVVPATQVSIADQEFSVDENSPKDFSIGTVQATSTDGVLEYEITNQSIDGAITINSDNGELSVANSDDFDYEENPVMTADIQATADGEFTTATITINLNDLFNLEEDKEALDRIFNANPNNTLGWDLTGDVADYEDINVIDDRVKAIIINDNKNINVIPDIALYNLTEIEILVLENNNLSDIAFANNKNLLGIYLGYNQLENIDLKELPVLQEFSIGFNKLTTIDLSNCSSLISLGIQSNRLTTLDLSELSNLNAISAKINHLTTVNIKNGNNINMNYVDFRDNSNLTCIAIDSGFTPDSSWNKPANVVYSETGC